MTAIVRLWGGLGNQMFQYAFGRRLAEETGKRVKFDLENGFRNDAYRRRPALSAFNTEIVAAEPREIPIGMSWSSPWHRLAKAGWSSIPAAWRRVVYDAALYQLDSSAVDRRNPAVYYFGYWQNERYFSPIRDVLRREFTLRSPLSATATALKEEIAQCRSVSLHVRCNLGIDADGQVVAKARDFHGSCSVEYFHQAIDVIGRDTGTVCYIFSDNPGWAKANVKLPIPCRYVADLCPCSDAEEMMLMASCQHHVIANSSFSWWGAWLGTNPQKVVVAPKIWVRALPEAAVDIWPQTWIKL